MVRTLGYVDSLVGLALPNKKWEVRFSLLYLSLSRLQIPAALQRDSGIPATSLLSLGFKRRLQLPQQEERLENIPPAFLRFQPDRCPLLPVSRCTVPCLAVMRAGGVAFVLPKGWWCAQSGLLVPPQGGQTKCPRLAHLL